MARLLHACVLPAVLGRLPHDALELAGSLGVVLECVHDALGLVGEPALPPLDGDLPDRLRGVKLRGSHSQGGL